LPKNTNNTNRPAAAGFLMPPGIRLGAFLFALAIIRRAAFRASRSLQARQDQQQRTLAERDTTPEASECPVSRFCSMEVFVPTTHTKHATGRLLSPVETLPAEYRQKRPGVACFLPIKLPFSGKSGESWEMFKNRQKLVNNLFSFLLRRISRAWKNLKSPESRESRDKKISPPKS
jgi:hypothetical protein